MVSSSVSKLPCSTRCNRPRASSAQMSRKRLYSSCVVPHSETISAPQKPSSMSRRTSWRIAFSLSCFRSLVNVGMMTLHTPRMCSRAQSFASRFVYCIYSTSSSALAAHPAGIDQGLRVGGPHRGVDPRHVGHDVKQRLPGLDVGHRRVPKQPRVGPVRRLGHGRVLELQPLHERRLGGSRVLAAAAHGGGVGTDEA